MRHRFLLVAVVCVIATSMAALPDGTATCSTRPSQPCEVGKPVTLTIPAITFPLQNVLWTFDDGTSVTTTTPSITHTFNTLGLHGTGVLINGESVTEVVVYIGYGFISVSSPTTTVPESVGSVTIAFTRTEASLPADVAFSTSDGTAKAGISYVATSGTVSFAAGELQKTITVSIIDNTSYDGNVFFSVGGTSKTAGYFVDNRTSAPGYAPDTSVNIFITENDPPPSLTFAQTSYSAHETDAQVTVTVLRANDLSHSAYGAIYVDWSNATPFLADVIAVSEVSFVFAPNETSKQVSVPIKHDGYYMGDATMPVVLTPTAPSTPGSPARANIYVSEADAPSLTINDVTVREGDAQQTALATFIVTTNSFPKMPATIQLVDGTAKQGVDFGSPSSTTFNVGGTSEFARTMAITVPIYGNDAVETNRTFTAVLGSSKATILRTGNCTIVDDDVTLKPSDMNVQSGSTEQLELRVGEPATVDRTINISSDAIAPPVVTMPAGLTSVQIPVTGGEWGDSLVTVTTSPQLFSRTFRTTVHVFTNATPHVFPLSLLMKPGASATLTADVFPEQPGPTMIVVTSSDKAVVTATSPIEVPPGGSAPLPITAKSAGHAVLTTYAGGVSMGTVSVTVADGDQPLLSAITPAQGAPAGGTTVLLEGGNFRDTCTVQFGGSDVPATFVDAQTISIVTPPHEAGSVDVEVTCGPQIATLPGAFTYFNVRRRSARH